jgi:putative glutamine amidotransferase
MRGWHGEPRCTPRASASYNRRVKPLILITVDEGIQPRGEVAFPAWVLKRAYTDAVARAGGLPLLAPPGADPDALMAAADGVVVTGGAFDLPPAWSGADVEGRVDPPRPERSAFERALLEAARARRRPALGICGGMQLMVVMDGGSLVGDIRTERPDFGEHEQPTSPDQPFHSVDLTPGTWLSGAVRKRSVPVNSTHHQGAVSLPPGLRALARCGDLVEALDDGTSDWVGVQWHPELLDDAVSRVLYANLIRAAQRSSAR